MLRMTPYSKKNEGFLNIQIKDLYNVFDSDGGESDILELKFKTK